MTFSYEVQDPKTLRQIPDQYRKCFECDKTRIDELRRSTLCCHVLCQACLNTKHDKFPCGRCGETLTKNDFVPYKRDDLLVKKDKRGDLPKSVKDLERNDFEDTPTYNNFLENVEKLNELMKTSSDKTKYKDLYDLIASKKTHKAKEQKTRARINLEAITTHKQKKQEATARVPTIGDLVQKGEVAQKNELIKEQRRKVDEQTKRVYGYDPTCVNKKKVYQALNWF
ncbi:hypothetical protein EIN_470030 [Entamoeba invadens IP1]|uniref:RING-type domain-containing protein n=1 Tax=Entamoeba invadens IP1 TaxID=370355 RepID=A0A0A1TUN3_ENTIV|nr:hypothetical protein EIN_470030 [Entamoeba invadens IP1]ELP83769.1 hypothetical protein EIN_470030 [Entamoeba invadens IP1]|eukprot:XP_004183115.1 hypothetical protein EIN_470030 [Entamoeba invadens IP1]